MVANIIRLSCLLLLFLPCYSPLAATPTSKAPTLVPDTFLRRWDPVTLFFNKEVGPAQGGPEDRPALHVQLTPAHPGAYTWLNARTLQFRPAEPWPPLTRFRWQTQGKTTSLYTLMSAPTQSLPAPGAKDLEPVQQITLTFPAPVNLKPLQEMLRIELSPLPGLSAQGKTHWLDENDFRIKAMPRQQSSDPASYTLFLHQAIPSNTQATLHLRLSLDDQSTQENTFHRITFSTAAPFQSTQLGCGTKTLPLSAKGVHYSESQALQCQPGQALQLTFSARPKVIGPVQARNLLRISPVVEQLRYDTAGKKLQISGQFKSNTLYKLTVGAGDVQDLANRPLQSQAPSELYLYFPARPDALKWKLGHGIVERFGPQMLSLAGRGFSRMDLRIHKIDPLDRSFWPFPNSPITVNEDQRPPGPGEQPPPFRQADRTINSKQLAAQIQALGSPAISTLMDLPLQAGGPAAHFGLDIKAQLAAISGATAPGTYLVGLRRLDHSPTRRWVRIQVTDLSLTTIEEADRVRFVVSSLKSGRPVANARIRVEATRSSGETAKWVELVAGTTNRSGQFSWQAPGSQKEHHRIRRIRVSKGKDSLVLNPVTPPDYFSDNHWNRSHQNWLQWTQSTVAYRGEPVRTLCHVFTERPVYRPDAVVHIKGYIRQRYEGRLRRKRGSGFLVVQGPNERSWRYPLDISKQGAFYHRFEEAKLPSGRYSAYFELRGQQCGRVQFKKEAYKLPRFEVKLHAPDIVPLDGEFKTRLHATYYAGGPVSKRPVRWRVTQFPYTWQPAKRPGYLFSSDMRFSDQNGLPHSPTLHQEGVTDPDGSTFLTLSPALEPDARPRQYLIEATVTGADDQTVTDTHKVLALPPFVLGLQLPRFLEKADHIAPSIVVLGPKGEALPDQKITLRLYHRQWHSHLRAGDFSQGVAQYVTEVVDEKRLERTLHSGQNPLTPKLPITQAGVYIVELEAHDRLGRAQVVKADLYVGGDEALSWSRPPSRIFRVSSDKDSYKPGETAQLVLESPFQDAHVLAVTEAPEGNRYQWLDVRNGAGQFTLPIEAHHVPRIPLHFILMRGRQAGITPRPDGRDMGKPTTLAATTWLTVEPVQHRLKVTLDYPEKALPGQKITLQLDLRDLAGRPHAGEATLWLVDQAVLSLGKEQRLDPLPDFITALSSHLSILDTRNLALGFLPFKENPGGGVGSREKKGLLDRVTIRKRFEAVPFYRSALKINAQGHLSVTVPLPDNLSNFKIRAKVISGDDRFGYATGHLKVRLPLIVQPALPRFVRPGDHFNATAIGRIVEGKGGPGRAEIRVQGAQLQGDSQHVLQWQVDQPQKIVFSLRVPSPSYDAEGKRHSTGVQLTLGIERTADQAKDAFQVTLPIRPDRQPEVHRQIVTLKPGAATEVKAITERLRPGTLRRTLLLSGQPELIQMISAINYLLDYPHGCTEQRLSQARARLASDQLYTLLGWRPQAQEIEQSIQATLTWLSTAVDAHGLIGYWPGSEGNVSLTAWAVQFMIEAEAAGYPIDVRLLAKLSQTLKEALRSDYGHFVDGEDYAERCWALTALADAGQTDSAYAAELARKAQYLRPESLAQVIRALDASEESTRGVISQLQQQLWEKVNTRLYQGREIYAGLRGVTQIGDPQILASETRTLAEIIHTLAATAGNRPQLQMMIDALVNLGSNDGWGDTQRNTAALLALSETLRTRKLEATVSLSSGQQQRQIHLDAKQPLYRQRFSHSQALQLVNQADQALVLRTESRYLPEPLGDQVAARAQGFVVRRELLHIQGKQQPAKRYPLEKAGTKLHFKVGDVIEEHIELINPEPRNYVALSVPLAAGLEPLNPQLATAPPEAHPSGSLSLTPTYSDYQDDSVRFYYNSLPKGTFHFYFRSRASISGSYTQPPAYAEKMYEQAVNGRSNGVRIVVE